MAKRVAIAIISLIMLSGCMYPGELRKENQVNPSEYMTVVQQAVNQFHTKNGVLPIKNSDMSTPIYEKYVIDFGKLQKGGYLSDIPANAFESGGVFMYVLVNPESKPEVKLIDLTAYQAAVDIQKLADDYRKKHNGEIPKGEKIAPSFYYLDFEKLGSKLPSIRSAYNRQSFIHFIIDESGRVTIDYGPDLMKLIESKGLAGSLEPGQDLRELLVAESYFVPVWSAPFRWSQNQPLPATE